MLDKILGWLADHTPYFFLLLAVIYATYFVTKRCITIVNRLKKTEEKCAKTEQEFLTVDGKLNTIQSSVTLLSGSFNSFVAHLQAKDQSINAQLFIARSPIQLTELGYEILVSINGKNYVDEHIGYLIDKMDKIGIKTALDSQTIAPIVITEISKDDSFIEIKNYMYKNPFYKAKINGNVIDIPLDISTVSNIMGIYLRDKYLEKHPELNPEDIPSKVNV